MNPVSRPGTVVETCVANHEPPENGPRQIVAFWQITAPDGGGIQQSTQQVPNTPSTPQLVAANAAKTEPPALDDLLERQRRAPLPMLYGQKPDVSPAGKELIRAV